MQASACDAVPRRMPNVFCRYHLRTTDPDAARSFYVDAVGLDFTEDGSLLAVWPLHEQARARGAPAHWLGHIDVTDVATTVQQLLADGSQLLGPPLLRGDDGEAFAVLRDPCEAVVAIRETSRHGGREPVAWHQLHTRDLDRSWALYSELFGWVRAGTVEVGQLEGGHRTFRWNGARKDVGSIANTARLPGVHPHWLFYFPVADLGSTLAKVTLCGGRALTPVVLPNGDRIVACEDPQGAAFGLIQRA
jgi:predicted enzyme related to lactoylglutathione lyase